MEVDAPGEPFVRTEERYAFVTDLTFQTDSGLEIRGRTSDVSLNGAFLFTETPQEGVKVGDGGVVFLRKQQDDNEFVISFPCTVARVSPAGLGLFFAED